MQEKCCCSGLADEREEKLRKYIESHKNTKGALIPVLHEAQNIYGYLPMNVQKIVAEGLEISLEEVYGVATFYTNFSLTQKGKYQIQVCLGTACYVKGANAILDKLHEKLGVNVGDCTEDGIFSLDVCRCVGACGLAPVISINGKVYGGLKPDDIGGIVDSYKNAE